MSNLGYTRKDLDFYPTPAWVTEAVIPYLRFYIDRGTPVWEPACGDGAMSEVLKDRFDNVTSTDIANYGYGQAGVDFLALNVHVRGLVITNPPYGDLAEAFVRQGLKVTERYQGVVAMLMRHEYDTAKGRVDLFNKPPFATKVVLTTRPRWIEGSTGAPRHSYAWYLWSWKHKRAPEVFYHVRGGKSE